MNLSWRIGKLDHLEGVHVVADLAIEETCDCSRSRGLEVNVVDQESGPRAKSECDEPPHVCSGVRDSETSAKNLPLAVEARRIDRAI